jgi:signal transduction histidine kinase
MLVLMIQNTNKNIEFAKQEQKGIQYQSPLEDLLELIPKHQQLLSKLATDPAILIPQILREREKIDAAFRQLELIDSKIGTDLQFTDKDLSQHKKNPLRVLSLREESVDETDDSWKSPAAHQHAKPSSVRAEWDSQKHHFTEISPETCMQQHFHFVSDVRMMISYAGDTSNLILDPDLDTYYLMDVTLISLPQTQDRLSKIISEGVKILEKKQINPIDRVHFKVAAALLKEADLNKVIESSQTALNEDANFYGVSETLQATIPPLVQKYERSNRVFIDLLNRLANLDKAEKITEEEYILLGNQARDSSFELWHGASRELTILLEKRIQSYEQDNHFIFTITGACIVVALFLVGYITHSISEPLKNQANELKILNETLEQDINKRKKAEEELVQTHKKLLEISHQAGMAEIATGVLHNVGNALNSVNVSSTLVTNNLRQSKVGNLSKIVGLLKEHQNNLGAFFENDPKGRQLPSYIEQLTKHLIEEQTEGIKELGHLHLGIEHIKDIVTTQQSYAKVSGLMETIQIRDLVEDALRMNSSSLVRHNVELIREFADTPPLTVDKHKVLQILVNLIRNAKYACDDSGRLDKKIIVKISAAKDYVQTIVSDNGVGIPQENMTRIFNHGFTTRKDGHGFGLHSAVLAAKEMKGSLTVQSEGTGKGASFTLILPLSSE